MPTYTHVYNIGCVIWKINWEINETISQLILFISQLVFQIWDVELVCPLTRIPHNPSAVHIAAMTDSRRVDHGKIAHIGGVCVILGTYHGFK